MKKLVAIVMTMGFLLTMHTVDAQSMTRKERRALKKEIRQYKRNPEMWVKMQKDHKKEVQDLNDEVTRLNDEIASLKAQLGAASAENKELTAKLAALENQYMELKKSMPSTELPDGVVYQVQLGFYEYLDLVSFNEKLKTVKAEQVGDKKRYVIGHFDDMMDAVQFSNDIKTLGIEDAFVSQYIDGIRNMEFDALEVIEQ